MASKEIPLKRRKRDNVTHIVDGPRAPVPQILKASKELPLKTRNRDDVTHVVDEPRVPVAQILKASKETPLKTRNRDVVTHVVDEPRVPVAQILKASQETPLKKRKWDDVTHVVDEPRAPVAQTILIKKLSHKARTPTRGSPLAAGYDLYSAEDKTIPARGKALVDIQLSIAVPSGTYGRVAPRSGLATKHMIDTGAGVIDADYRGPVFILLFNLSDKDFHVSEGDRIAQLIIERIYTPDILEVESLDETLRGAAGFGSTGGHQSL